MPVIDRERCNGCGLCVSVCRCNALALVDNVIIVTQKEACASCTRWCSECEAVCPEGAISYPFEITIEER